MAHYWELFIKDNNILKGHHMSVSIEQRDS